MTVKIHAWLAKQLPISRREAEKRVASGLVMVDGKRAEIGQIICGDEVISMSGEVIKAESVERRLLLMHKKVGWVCSSAPQNGQESVFDHFPKLNSGKWILVGRLDLNTSGLLLVTNDGYLANCFAHPSSGFVRKYLVRVSGEIKPAMRKELLGGVKLEDGMSAFDSIRSKVGSSKTGTNRWYQVTLTEGKNRIVRRLMAAMGLSVSRLVRVAFGPFVLEKGLRPGHYEEVEAKWLEQLIKKQQW